MPACTTERSKTTPLQLRQSVLRDKSNTHTLLRVLFVVWLVHSVTFVPSLATSKTVAIIHLTMNHYLRQTCLSRPLEKLIEQLFIVAVRAPLPWRTSVVTTDLKNRVEPSHCTKFLAIPFLPQRHSIVLLWFEKVSSNGKMTICGTDEYMAPEMLFDESFSYPADMFSFGEL